MTLNELAAELIAANREGRTDALLDAHYAPDAVSVEAFALDPSRDRETAGIEGIKGKHAWWDSAVTMHDFKIEGPFMHGEDRFALIFEIDVTMKDTGNRETMREVAVYHAKDGKIVREEFFYSS